MFNYQIKLFLVRHRSDINIEISPETNSEFLRLFRDQFNKFVINRTGYVNTFNRSTHLTTVGESAPNRTRGGQLNISVFQNDHRVLATKFH